MRGRGTPPRLDAGRLVRSVGVKEKRRFSKNKAPPSVTPAPARARSNRFALNFRASLNGQGRPRAPLPAARHRPLTGQARYPPMQSQPRRMEPALSILYRHDLPHARPGERIGLLGGSFDPPHQGHVQISLEALKRFRLDRVWWLVSPGNPLKARGPAALPRRLEAARDLIRDPRILVTDIEAKIGTRYTSGTLREMFRLYPKAHFVWLMGADNLADFHRWRNWQQIMSALPIGVIARPGSRLAARTSPAAARFRAARLRQDQAERLALLPAPAWCLINVPMSSASSTAIRAKGGWTA